MGLYFTKVKAFLKVIQLVNIEAGSMFRTDIKALAINKLVDPVF